MLKFKNLSEKLTKIASTPFENIISLDRLLADEYIIYAKLRNYHWNVIGFQFNDLHKFFETQYILIEEYIDQIAERIRALNARTPATLSEFLKITRLKEPPTRTLSPNEMIVDLLNDYEIISKILKDMVKKIEPSDSVTANYLADLAFKHEKTAWQLRSLATQL